MSAVRLSPEAESELAEAAAWYAARRPGLAMEFLTEVGCILLLMLLIGTSRASFPRFLHLPGTS